MRNVISASETSSAESPIQSVERAARILGLFSVERPALSLAELTVRLGVSKATTHRYAVALRRANLLRHDPASGLYTLGPKIVELAAAALAGLRIIKVAGPYMERLVGRINETVVLSMWDGEAPIVVRVDDNTDRLVRINVRTGARLPALTSAQGKIYCAFLPEGERPKLSGASNQASLEAELAEIRRRGLAVNSLVVEGIRAVAVPLFQHDRLAGALAVVGTTASIPDEVDSAIAGALRETAYALSAELGFVSDGRAAPRRQIST